MDETQKKEVLDLIASSIKPVTDQVGQLAEAVKPVATLVKSVEDLGKNVGVVADTLAKLPPARAGTKPEEIAKLVTDQLAAKATADAQATAASTKKADARKKVIETKLKGVPESLIKLPDTDDEAALTAAAEQLRKDIVAIPGVKLPDVGGTAGDGGQTADKGAPPKYTPGNSSLSEGQAALANSIKLPA